LRKTGASEFGGAGFPLSLPLSLRGSGGERRGKGWVGLGSSSLKCTRIITYLDRQRERGSLAILLSISYLHRDWDCKGRASGGAGMMGGQVELSSLSGIGRLGLRRGNCRCRHG
jgi:hypothetical protein